MESFRALLQREFDRRLEKNPRYSLRAYANFLKVNHATLSSVLSGKRKITAQTIINLSQPLALTAEEIEHHIAQADDQILIEDNDDNSTTIAVSTADLPEAKKLIKKFRQEIKRHLQKNAKKTAPTFQLQISVPPLDP